MGRAILAGFGAGAAFAMAVLVVVAAALPPPPVRAPTPRIVSAAPSVEMAAREAATGPGRPAAESPGEAAGKGGDATAAAPGGRERPAETTGARAAPAVAERAAGRSPGSERAAPQDAPREMAALPSGGGVPGGPEGRPASAVDAVETPSAPARLAGPTPAEGAAQGIAGSRSEAVAAGAEAGGPARERAEAPRDMADKASPAESGARAPLVAVEAGEGRRVDQGRAAAPESAAEARPSVGRAPTRAAAEAEIATRDATDGRDPAAGVPRADPAQPRRPAPPETAEPGDVPGVTARIAALETPTAPAGTASRAGAAAPGRIAPLTPGREAAETQGSATAGRPLPAVRSPGEAARQGPATPTSLVPEPPREGGARRVAAPASEGAVDDAPSRTAEPSAADATGTIAALAPRGEAGAVAPDRPGTDGAAGRARAPARSPGTETLGASRASEAPRAGATTRAAVAPGAETPRAAPAPAREARAAEPRRGLPVAPGLRAEAALADRRRATEVRHAGAAFRSAPVARAARNGGEARAAAWGESPGRQVTGRTVRRATVAPAGLRDAAARRAPARAGLVRPSAEARAGASSGARIWPATVGRQEVPRGDATSRGTAVPARAEPSPRASPGRAARAAAQMAGAVDLPTDRPAGAVLPLPPGYEARPPDRPETERVAQAEPGAGGLGDPVAPLTERPSDRTVPGVRILRPPSGPSDGDGGARRLPGSGPVAPIVEAETAPEPPEAAPQEGAPALARNAAAFEGAAGAPLLSVVLRHTGAVTPERVAALGLPLTMAVDPDAPGAEETVAAYRAAGLEVVLAGLGLPEGATPRDAEVTLAARFSRFPDVIGVLDRRAEGFAGDLALTAQIAGILEADGYGLLIWDSGLNSALGVAERTGAAAGLVWRQVDDEGMSAPAVGRRLGRAAFEAARDGAVIVMAQTRPATLEALAAFAGETGRATLAPASAVLMRE